MRGSGRTAALIEKPQAHYSTDPGGNCRIMGEGRARCLSSTERSDTAEARTPADAGSTKPRWQPKPHYSTVPGGVPNGSPAVEDLVVIHLSAIP